MPDIITSALEKSTIAGEYHFLHTLTGLFTAFILPLILALIYKKIHSRKEDCHVIMQSMIFISVILAGAMMVIGNNLAIAFGLVGAVSIIRFRTSVSSFLDMSFIFGAIVVGMASGLGFYYLAIVITVFLGSLMLLLNHFKFGMNPPLVKEYEITLLISDADLTQEKVLSLIEFDDTTTRFIEYKSMNKKKRIKFFLAIDKRSQLGEFENKVKERLKGKSFQLRIQAN